MASTKDYGYTARGVNGTNGTNTPLERVVVDDAQTNFGTNTLLQNGVSNGVHAVVEVPVLIIGGGPTGLLLSHLLSKLGVKSLVVERYPERLGAPKAHALSPRSMEICRQFDLDVTHLRDIGTKRADAYWVNFVTDLSGERVGVLPYERMDTAVLDETPEMIHNIPQPAFEQFLTSSLRTDDNVDIRKGVSFVSLESHDDGVLTTVEERATGTHFQIRSKHVVACDGAKSKTREFLGIESDGEDSYETMMTIHFNADLRPVVGKRVGMLHWIMDPAAAGFIIGYDLSGNQVLISNFDAKKHPVDTWNEALCRQVVNTALGAKVPFDVLSYRPWILSRKICKEYRRGNIFLAGDAAHSFPPTGGLGLNSGLADVHNLAYKLAAVHEGWASDKILDTYQSERRHVAEINSKQSVKNGRKIFGLLKSLGTAGIKDLEEARRNLYKTIHDPEMKIEIEEQIEGQREHFDNLELHIGYVYGSDKTPPNASLYVPKYVPGARLPHVWVTLEDSVRKAAPKAVDVSYVEEFGAQEADARKYTSLDLCARDGFTLIIGPQEVWDDRLQQVRHEFQSTGLRIVSRSLGRDFEVAAGERGSSWIQSLGLNRGGGVVVRPDQHILTLLTAESSPRDIANVIREHLGR